MTTVAKGTAGHSLSDYDIEFLEACLRIALEHAPFHDTPRNIALLMPGCPRRGSLVRALGEEILRLGHERALRAIEGIR